MIRRAVLALLALPHAAGADSVLAARTLPAGTLIAPADVQVVTDDLGAPSTLEHVVGQQLRSIVYEGRRIEGSDLTAPDLVERNQFVTLIYDKPPLRIEAEGRALTAGAVGQTIRVMNSASRVTVSGRVSSDGSVLVDQF